MKSLDLGTTLAIVSFLFAIGTWLLSERRKDKLKVDRLTEVIKSIHAISGNTIWESKTVLSEVYETRVKQAEKNLVSINNIYQLTTQYIHQKSEHIIGDIGLLVEKNIIWTGQMIWALEASKEITEIWLFTPDLKPDVSEDEVGKAVNANIKNGKKYVYFFPDNLPHLKTEINRLYNNIGLTEPATYKYKNQVNLVPLSYEKYRKLFNGGNIILFFSDEHRSFPPKCFEELILNKIDERALFWQENSEKKAKELRELFGNDLKKLTQLQSANIELT